MAGLIYQGATGSLTSTPSLITYTTKMTLLTQPNYTWVPGADNSAPVFKDVAPNIEDLGYVNGIYTAATTGTYSVGASLGISGTISLNSELKLTIQVSADGVTWQNLVSDRRLFAAGISFGTAYRAFLIPCAAGGKIRVVASTTVVLPVISSNLDDNTLAITRIF